MEADDSFTFCQDAVMASPFAAFQDMKEHEQLVDFRINIGNLTLSAHRVVMAAAIPYFRTLFVNSECEIPLETIDPNVLEPIINFAYCRRITITPGNVRSLLSASKFLQLSDVHDACIDYLGWRLHVNNWLEIRTLAENLQSVKLKTVCDHYILNNFNEVVQSEEYLSFPFVYLKEIISSDELNVSNEEVVFYAVMRWVKACPADRHSVLPELLCAVRLSLLTPKYLIETVSAEDLIRSSIPCRDLVEETKNYFLVPKFGSSLLDCMVTYPRDSVRYGLYAFGYSVEVSVERYVLPKNVWIPVTAYIGSRSHCNISTLNGKIYGFWKKRGCIRVDKFNMDTLKWQDRHVWNSSLGAQDTIQQVVAHNSKLYVLLSNQMIYFDPAVSKWFRSSVSGEFEGAGFAALGCRLYVTGGCIEKSHIFSTCKTYHSSPGVWKEISPMLDGRSYHGCCSLNGKMYVCGGLGDEGVLDSSEVYNPLTNQWSTICKLPSAGHHVSLLPYEQKLYAFGNSFAAVYDPERDEWEAGVPVSSRYKEVRYVAVPEADTEKAFKRSCKNVTTVSSPFSNGGFFPALKAPAANVQEKNPFLSSNCIPIRVNLGISLTSTTSNRRSNSSVLASPFSVRERLKACRRYVRSISATTPGQNVASTALHTASPFEFGVTNATSSHSGLPFNSGGRFSII